MKIYSKLLVILAALVVFGCKTSQPIQKNEEVQITFLHLNDVYEISPISGGKSGGLARVATVRNELLKENPNTYTILSGDFLSPSVIGMLKYEGNRIQGRQMVDVLNATGIDFVCFGNHEFDVKEEDLLKRINESNFTWVNSNAWHVTSAGSENFYKLKEGKKEEFPRNVIIEKEGVRVGLFGIVLPSNPKNFVAYDDFFESATKTNAALAKTTDVVVGITHINKADDRKLATMLPNVPLFMGGHDHDNMIEKVGNVTIAKADANARTVYVHRLFINKITKKIRLTSELKVINDQIAEDPQVKQVVDKWETIAANSLKEANIDKNNVIYTSAVALDGREASVRNEQSNLAQLIVKSIQNSFAEADAAIFNGGSIRIDDQLQGAISELDVVRVLPFGGKVAAVKINGRLLEQILLTGIQNKGNGGYLHWSNITQKENQFLINGKLLDNNATYTVAMPEFLLTGLETNLGYLNRQNPSIVSIEDKFGDSDVRNDIRRVVIEYLKKL